MIVALARKLLIALWRLVTTGEVPDGVALRLAAWCSKNEKDKQGSAPDCAWVADDDQISGNPHSAMAMPLRMDPPPRRFARKAYLAKALMVRIYMGSTEYKRGSRD